MQNSSKRQHNQSTASKAQRNDATKQANATNTIEEEQQCEAAARQQ
jgi:hypothetical protein